MFTYTAADAASVTPGSATTLMHMQILPTLQLTLSLFNPRALPDLFPVFQRHLDPTTVACSLIVVRTCPPTHTPLRVETLRLATVGAPSCTCHSLWLPAFAARQMPPRCPRSCLLHFAGAERFIFGRNGNVSASSARQRSSCVTLEPVPLPACFKTFLAILGRAAGLLLLPHDAL